MANTEACRLDLEELFKVEHSRFIFGEIDCNGGGKKMIFI